MTCRTLVNILTLVLECIKSRVFLFVPATKVFESRSGVALVKTKGMHTWMYAWMYASEQTEETQEVTCH